MHFETEFEYVLRIILFTDSDIKKAEELIFSDGSNTEKYTEKTQKIPEKTLNQQTKKNNNKMH